MAPLVGMLVTLSAWGAFVALTRLEAKRGTRVWGGRRAVFDVIVTRFSFILEHVDFAGFVREEARHGADQAGHALAHLSLQFVRWIERLLTQAVRSFRVREATRIPRESSRAFVRTLSEFKEHLKATAPVELPELEQY